MISSGLCSKSSALLAMLRSICLVLIFSPTNQSSPQTSISIRGHPQPQMLPSAHCSSWPVWTCELSGCDGQTLQAVDNDADEGWVNPTSFDSLFYPSDLPMPLARPAIGVVMANGSPRYLMPSLVLTLETPSKMWRNRGLCSIPRARAWIDMFAAYASPVERLRLSSFGQLAPDVRFLEDAYRRLALLTSLHPTAAFSVKSTASEEINQPSTKC